MAKPTLRPVGLNGEAGLLAAVIHRAALDSISGDYDEAADALAYFAGPVYLHHITALDGDPDRVPAALMNQETLDRVIDLILMTRKGAYYERSRKNEYDLGATII